MLHGRWLMGFALAFLVAGTAGDGRSASLGDESWYDADHGWRVVGLKAIQQTDDGGATWRRLPNPLGDLGGDRCGYRDRSGRLRGARFVATRVATLPEGPLRAAVIPGGVVAASFGPHPRALVARWLRRGAAPRVAQQELPGLGGPNDPVAFWSSSDGGSHWRVIGARG